jgi:lysophospholipase L1-like esterase
MILKGFKLAWVEGIPLPETGQSASTAAAYITAENIGNTAYRTAVHKLVDDLRALEVWNGFKAIYLGLGNNRVTNLKKPGTYNLTFPNGKQDNGDNQIYLSTNRYGDTGIALNTLKSNDVSMFFHNSNEGASGDLMGATGNSLKYGVGNIKYSYQNSDNNISELGAGTIFKKGLYMSNVKDGLSTLYLSGTKNSKAIDPEDLSSNLTITLGGVNSGSGVTTSANTSYGIAAIGDGIPDELVDSVVDIFNQYLVTVGLVKLNSRALIFGDSITAGANATQGNDYHTVYQNITGIWKLPMGEYGRTLQKLPTNSPSNNSLERVVFDDLAGSFDFASFGTYLHHNEFKYLMIRLGVNDILQMSSTENPVSAFDATYRKVLDRLIVLKWPINKIKLLNCGMVNPVNFPNKQTRLEAFNQVIFNLGQDYGMQVVDFYSNQAANGGYSLMTDGLHPDNAGHALDGQYLATQCP